MYTEPNKIFVVHGRRGSDGGVRLFNLFRFTAVRVLVSARQDLPAAPEFEASIIPCPL
jgi:hypothetical protein